MKMNTQPRGGWLAVVGPGILVAATGVGAGDLATAAFAGGRLGVAVLWAVLLGAFLKFVLNEGLARWQLATGETLLEGAVHHFGKAVNYLFLGYLVLWSGLVAVALMSACGVVFHAIWPMFNSQTDKIVYGLAHSALAVLLVRWGGYRLFERVMSVCIGVMFVIVVVTAVAVGPNWTAVLRGLFVPTLPAASGDAVQWTVALMGGVGGTVTVLCYGYWIREIGRNGADELRTCRLDLASGYIMTAIFGIAMVILGSQVTTSGSGSRLVVLLADRLEEALGAAGPTARWAFLIGAWGAVGTSLLGVWQSVPYLFADFVALHRGTAGSRTEVRTDSPAYRGYLYALATIPAVGLAVDFQRLQKIYAIIGAAFIPMLAAALLVLNGRRRYIGEPLRNSPLTNVVLVLAILFFAAAGVLEVRKHFGG